MEMEAVWQNFNKETVSTMALPLGNLVQLLGLDTFQRVNPRKG